MSSSISLGSVGGEPTVVTDSGAGGMTTTVIGAVFSATNAVGAGAGLSGVETCGGGVHRGADGGGSSAFTAVTSSSIVAAARRIDDGDGGGARRDGGADGGGSGIFGSAFSVFSAFSGSGFTAVPALDAADALDAVDALDAIGVVAEVALMAFSGPILRRFSASWLLVAAFLGGALRWALIAFVPDVTALLLLQPLHALSFALFWVTALDLVKKRAPREVLATAQGVFNAAVGAGAVAGMFAWGALFKAYGGRVTFVSAAGVAVCAALVAAGVDRVPARASEAEVV
jgi:hypothetical protein